MTNKLYLFKFIIISILISSCHQSNKFITVKKGEIKQYISGMGKIHGASEASLTALTPGQIQEWKKDEGAYFSKNEVILIISDHQLEASFNQAKIEYLEMERRLKRTESLLKKKAISGVEHEEAYYNFQKSRNAFDQIKAKLDLLTITAPFDGILIRKYYDIGESISHGNKVGLFADLRKLKVFLEIDETDIRYIKLKQRVDLKIDSYPGEKITGYVSKIGMLLEKKRQPLDDSKTFTDTSIVPIEVDISADPKLKIGSTVIGYITVSEKKDVLLVPKSTVLQNGPNLYVLKSNHNKIEKQEIHIGNADERNYEIINGLTEGDLVIQYE